MFNPNAAAIAIVVKSILFICSSIIAEPLFRALVRHLNLVLENFPCDLRSPKCYYF